MGGTAFDTAVNLIKNGVVGGTNLSTASILPNADTVTHYSASPGGWGTALTYADVNRTNFGVALAYGGVGGPTNAALVDSVTIIIDYSCGGSNPCGIQKHSIVRLRKGSGNYYLIDQMPWEDLFRRTGVVDTDGAIAFLRYYDQTSNSWKDGQEVRIVEPG